MHDDLDSPPDLPAFRNETGLKKAKRESLSDALTGAVVAFKKAFADHSKSPPRRSAALSQQFGISPGKTIELRMKFFEQLRYLQKLYEAGKLTTIEYEEQKEKILKTLKELN